MSENENKKKAIQNEYSEKSSHETPLTIGSIEVPKKEETETTTSSSQIVTSDLGTGPEVDHKESFYKKFYNVIEEDSNTYPQQPGTQNPVSESATQITSSLSA